MKKQVIDLSQEYQRNNALTALTVFKMQKNGRKEEREREGEYSMKAKIYRRWKSASLS